MALFAKLPSLGVVLRFEMAAFGILDNDGRPQSANRTMATALTAGLTLIPLVQTPFLRHALNLRGDSRRYRRRYRLEFVV
jgi:hypothetical protein